MKEATDRVSDIDFPLYSDIDITDPRYQIDDQAIAFEYVEDDGETVVFMQQREFDPQNDMMSYIYTDLSITDDGLEEENMLEKYYDGDEERFEEEFVNPLTDVYVDSLVRYFNNDDDLSLHVNYMQSDYIISYLAHEEDADSDTTVQKSWDIINDAVYDIREQERIPREIDERLRQAKRMLLDGTFNELYTDGEYQYATDPDTVETFPDTLGEYLKKQQ